MVSGILMAFGILIGIVIIFIAATAGFASGVMHLLKWLINKIRWLFAKD